jgi:hypothetical protein
VSAGDRPTVADLVQEARAQAGVPDGEHHHIAGGPLPVPYPDYDTTAWKEQ